MRAGFFYGAGSPRMNLTYRDIEQLFCRHRRELARSLYKIVRCEETAADLCQETYLRLINLAKHTAVAYPRALLHRTARNLAIDHLRKRQLHASYEAVDAVTDEVPSPMPSADDAIDARQRYLLLRRAVATLAPKCRTVFLLHKAEHLSYAQIAARLNISTSAVEKHMSKALALCRDALEQEGR